MTRFHYLNADSLQQALVCLNDPGMNVRIVAGATDLMLEIERGMHPMVDSFVDISRVPGLNKIFIDGKGFIHLGAMVTHNDVVGSTLLRQFALPLVLACWEVGSPQIRNRGTVVGNLVTGSPANDTITPLMALDAQLKLVSLKGSRLVPLKEFYRGVRSTILQPNELVEEIIFKKLSVEQKGAFYKYALRQAQAISVVNAAVVLEMDKETVVRASITLGAVAPTIIHAPEAENFLHGKILTEEVIEEAGRLASACARPISDLRATANFRRYITGVIVKRALLSIKNDSHQARLLGKPALLKAPVTMVAPSNLPQTIKTEINGKSYQFTLDHFKSLLDLLREDAGLVGTKEGCAEGECGACTVHMDGAAVMGCLVPAHRADGSKIVTIEGVAKDEVLHPVQQAFIDAGAVQCGYCTPGLIMSSVKLLEEIPNPSQDQIVHALTGNLCRCTGYYKVIEAVEKAVSGGM